MALEESGGAKLSPPALAPLCCHCGAERLYDREQSSIRFTMPARIYKPSKTAMQSGSANTKCWVLDFEPGALSSRDGLMR